MSYYLESVIDIIGNQVITLCGYVLTCLTVGAILGNYVTIKSNLQWVVYVLIGIAVALPIIVIGWIAYVDAKKRKKANYYEVIHRQQQAVRDAEKQAKREKNYATIYNYADYEEGGNCGEGFSHEVYGDFDHAAYDCVKGKIKRKEKYKDFNEQCLPGHTRTTRIACDESGQTYIDR